MSIKRSLTIFLTIICLGLGGTTGMFIWSFSQNERLLEVVEAALGDIQAIVKTRTAVYRQMKETLDFVVTGEESEKIQYLQFHDEAMTGFKEWIEASERSRELGTRNEDEDIDRAQHLRKRYQGLTGPIGSIYDGLKPEAKALVILEELDPRVDQLISEMDEGVAAEVEEAYEAYAEVLFRAGVMPWMHQAILQQVHQSQLALSYLLAIEDVRVYVIRQIKELEDLFVLGNGQKHQMEYELAKGKRKEAMEKWFNVVERQRELGVPGEEEDLTLARSVKLQLQKIDDLSEQAFVLIRAGAREDVVQLLEEQIERHLDRMLLTILEEAAIDAREEISNHHANLQDLTLSAGGGALGVIAVLGVFTIVVLLRLKNNILLSLGGLTRGTEVIGKGQWDHHIPVDPNTELGQLASAFNGMTENLRRSYAELEEKVKERTCELEEKNAELERFNYTASHDLKSPLITIRGFLGLLEEDLAKGNAERVQSDMQKIYGATEKMQNLLADLLEFSRIGHVASQVSEVSLKEVAEEALSLVAGQIKAGGLRIDLSPALPVVWGDRTRLTEVYQNLIDNAVKYQGAQPDPYLAIGVRSDGEDVVLYVRDNGMGIDPRYHDKVFGLFEQLSSSSHGTGIGLALVKRIVESHGGCIWVESQGLGQGTTFCWTLSMRQGGKNIEDA